MSHHGTNWAIIQRGLKPTTKIVLWHLCDRHNPDYGCFPTQARLAHDCEISRAGLNTHLALLEACELLRRERRIDPVTKRQMSTRYFLGFEDDFTPISGNSGNGSDGNLDADLDGASGNDSDAKTGPSGDQLLDKPCPKLGHGIDSKEQHENKGFGENTTQNPCPRSGHRAVSRKTPDPCPENGQSRVQNLDTNPVREPLREPVKEEEERAGARDDFFESSFGEILKALGFDPKGVLPAWWQGESAKANVRRWGDDLGLSEDQILEVAAETRREHPVPPDGPRALDRAMERASVRHRSPPDGVSGSKRYRGRDRSQTDSGASLEVQLEFYSGIVNSDKYLPQNMISNRMCNAMLAHGLVTPERLQMRGLL